MKYFSHETIMKNTNISQKQNTIMKPRRVTIATFFLSVPTLDTPASVSYFTVVARIGADCFYGQRSDLKFESI
jgi:hypothetical protein